MVILLTVFYGLRRSEVLGLKWDAIDFENDTITIRHTVTYNGKGLHKSDTTKNDSSYAVIPMSSPIKKKLKQWQAQQRQYKWLQPNDFIDDGYICTRSRGTVNYFL